VRTADVVTRRANDPVDFVHRYDDPNDREVVALLAATLAFGNVVAVRRSIARVLELLGPTPHRAIDDERRLARALRASCTASTAARTWRGCSRRPRR